MEKKRCLFVLGMSLLLLGCTSHQDNPSSSASNSTSGTTNFETSSLGETGMSLVKESSSPYQIVIALKASETETYAANQLHSYFHSITGADVPVVSETGLSYSADSQYIVYGDSVLAKEAGFTFDSASLNGDGFCLKVIGKSLFIGGVSDNSYLNGTFEILESTLGVRFLSGDDTYVPSNVKDVPLYQYDRCYAPLLKHCLYLNAYDYNNSTSKALYMAHQRFVGEYCDKPSYLGENISWSRDVGSPDHNSLLYVKPADYDKDGDSTVDDAYIHMFSHYGDDTSKELTWCDSRTGGLVETRDLNSEVLDLCFTDGIAEDGSLDKNKETSTVKAMISAMEKIITNNGGVTSTYYMLGQMDRLIGCPCDRCKGIAEKYKRSGLMIRFANVVADNVQKWVDENYPGQSFNLVLFAYHYTIDAPIVEGTDGTFSAIDETIVPHSNVFVRIANIDAEYYYPLDDAIQDVKVNNPFTRWGALTKNTMTWSYSCDFNDIFWYYNTIHTFKKTILFLKRIGTQYGMIQSNYFEPTVFMPTLEAYVASKLFWNPYQDSEAIVKDFLVHYVGEKAAPYVQEYLKMMNNRYQYLLATDTSFYPTSSTEAYKAAKYWPVEFLDQAVTSLNKAIQASQEDASLSNEEKSEIEIRLEKIQLTPRYMKARNFGYYYPSSPVEQRSYVEGWASDAKRLGAARVGENITHTIDYFVSTYGGQ